MKIEPIYAAIGARIKTQRKRKGISQESLAAKIALTRTSVVNIEQGRQRLLVHTVAKIADALGVDQKKIYRGLL